VDFRPLLDKVSTPFMKNDTTTVFLNFVLAALVIVGVVLAYLNMKDTRELRYLNPRYMEASNFIVKIQALANDVAAYNAQAKSPELTSALKAIEAHPAH
jgi:hypothetical protein